jgi:hypothetical protein
MSEILIESRQFANEKLAMISLQLGQINTQEVLCKRITDLMKRYDPNNCNSFNEQMTLNPKVNSSSLYFGLILIRHELNKIHKYPNYIINSELTENNDQFNNN